MKGDDPTIIAKGDFVWQIRLHGLTPDPGDIGPVPSMVGQVGLGRHHVGVSHFRHGSRPDRIIAEVRFGVKAGKQSIEENQTRNSFRVMSGEVGYLDASERVTCQDSLLDLHDIQ
jgi:hypothetical protein